MSVFLTVPLRNQSLNREEVCGLGWLDASHIPAILQLQDRAFAGMAGNAEYYPQTEHELLAMFTGGGMAVGAFAGDALIAFHTALVPGRTADNLGIDLGLSGALLDQVAHLENSSVAADYRGNRLQQQLAEQLIGRFRQEGVIRYLCETVAPANIPSIRSTLANQLWIVDLKVKYDGHLRYLFLRDLANPPAIEDRTDCRLVSMANIPGQQQLFRQGYYAVRMERQGETNMLALTRDLR